MSSPDKLSITATTLRTAYALGFDRTSIVAALQSLERSHFYKSRTSLANFRQWPDVYHLPWGDFVLYVKFTDDAVSEFAVLSFKERNDG
jgi:motility quorum-sensing regulator/GCU-specific mRNA interferase toxin